MTLRGDSYSSTGEVKALTAWVLDGQTSFNSTTRPTGTQVERFINRASGALNMALAGAGFSTPITNTTAKLVCDEWVTAQSCMYVELAQRGSGYSDAEGSRTATFANLAKRARDFADENRQGFIRLGIPQSYRVSDGLQFTGLDAVGQRSDPDDTSLAQPKFTRSLFNDPAISASGLEDDDD